MISELEMLRMAIMNCFLNKSSLDQFRIWSKDLSQSELNNGKIMELINPTQVLVV